MKFYRVMLLMIAGLFVLLPGALMADSREVSNIGVLAHRGQLITCQARYQATTFAWYRLTWTKCKRE